MRLTQVTVTDDLKVICEQMQPTAWGKDNEMTSYQPENLRTFLNAGGLLLLARDEANNDFVAGAALCYELLHPGGEHNLYVHELDTHPDYRRKGVATALMKELTRLALERGLKEVWLGTETDNDAANALYRSLNPYETEPSIIYSFKA